MGSKLRVLQLIPTLDRCGAEKQMVLLARLLPRDRFTSEVAVLTRGGPLEAELQAAGIPVTHLGKRHKLDPVALYRLVRFLRANPFDIVQTWIFAADSYGRLAAKLAGVPVVVTTEMAVDLWKGSSHLWIDRRLAAWTDKVVGNSHAVTEFYERAGIPKNKLAMIYSGIVPEPPAPVDRAMLRQELGFAPDAPLIVFAGRLAPQKGVVDLINALDLLQHVMPQARTVLLGDGPQRALLDELVNDYALTHAVRFLGHREDATRFLAGADVVVLPSLYEGLPNVLMEAMLHARPVVATAAPGTTELVVPNVTGRLVPVHDHKTLAQTLREVLADPDQAAILGNAGRLRVLQEFSADLMITRFANLYEELAAAKIPRS